MDTEELKHLPMFSALAQDDLYKIATFATETSVAEGKALAREGDYAYELTFIQSGTADVIKNGEVIGHLTEGDAFGEMGMLEGDKRTADVVATSSMRLVTLTSWDMRRMPKPLLEQLRELMAERRRENAERSGD